MNLAEALASNNPDAIKTALFEQLQAQLNPTVLTFNQEYNIQPTPEAQRTLLTEFATSSDGAAPKRDPKLLQQWTHYRWILIELTNIINKFVSVQDFMQKKEIAYKQIMALNQKRVDYAAMTPEDKDCLRPAPSSLAIEVQRLYLKAMPEKSKIKVKAENGTSYWSVKVDDTPKPNMGMDFRKFQRQITEGPETPPAAETIPMNNIISAIEEHKATGATIAEIIAVLKQMRPQIVSTEHPTDPLSENARDFLTQFANALEDQATNEESISSILKNLIDCDTIPHARRTPQSEVSRTIELSLRPLYQNFPRYIKEIETTLRVHYGEECFAQNRKEIRDAINFQVSYWAGLDADGNTSITDTISTQSIVQYREAIANEHISALESILSTIPEEQKSQLIECIAEIRQFQKRLSEFINKISKDPDDLYIIEGHTKTPIAEFILNQYEKLLETQARVLKNHPELAEQLDYFGCQLRCFGMSYGTGHIRQDSSIFRKVWEVLCTELLTEPTLANNSIINLLRKRYTAPEESDWIHFHQRLQENSHESQELLLAIRNLHNGKSYKTKPKDEALVNMELNRLQLAKKNADLIEDIIISNTQGERDYLGVCNLLHVFPKMPHQKVPTVIPLLETQDDLYKYKEIIAAIIKPKLQQTLEFIFDVSPEEIQQRLKAHFPLKESIKTRFKDKNLKELGQFIQTLDPILCQYLEPFLGQHVIEVMLGFSDTQRVSGFGASLLIQQTREEIIQFVQNCRMNPKIYCGPGGEIARHDHGPNEKETVQGRARQAFDTPNNTQEFQERQFAAVYRAKAGLTRQMEITSLPKKMRHWLNQFIEASTAFYREFQDPEGMGKPLGSLLALLGWNVAMFNSSSRNTLRGVADASGDRTASVQKNGERPPTFLDMGKLRAISAMYAQQLTLMNTNFMGPSVGGEKIGIEKTAILYANVDMFRVMVLKETIGTTLRNLSISAQLFDDYPQLNPFNITHETRQQWAAECKNGFPGLVDEELDSLDFKKFSQLHRNKELLLTVLSRLFAYIQVESERANHFLSKLNKVTHPNRGERLASLMAHYPKCEAQIKELVSLADPLIRLYTTHCQQVIRGEYLDEKYPGLNNPEGTPDGELSGVAAILGDEVATMMAAWVPPPAYTVIVQDKHANRNTPAFFRAKREAHLLGRTIKELPNKSKPNIRFFEVPEAETQDRLNNLSITVETKATKNSYLS